MIRRLVSASMVMAFALSAGAAVASPFHLHTLNVAAMAKTKLVSLNLRNDTKTQVTITAGEKQMTLKPGETESAKLPVGAKIVAGEGSTQAPGTVLAVVAKELSDATVVLH